MSIHSPKNKFRVELSFSTPQGEIGSVVGYTANSVEDCKALAIQQAGSGECLVTIYENKKEYPSFDWQKIESYKIIK